MTRFVLPGDHCDHQPLNRIGTYIVGFVLPWLMFVIAAVSYGRPVELLRFPERLFGSGCNYFLVACLNVIPFIVVAIAAFVDRKIGRRSRPRKLGITVGGIAVLVVSAIYQSLAWFDLMGHHPDALIGLLFYILPWVATLAFFVSGPLPGSSPRYGCGERFVLGQSARNASIGSARLARRAGP